MSRGRVLIIEADEFVTALLTRFLVESDYEVFTATSARQGFDKVRELLPDAILCDVMMDEGGGEAFYSWLRRERPSSAGRVIFVTGGVTDEASRRFLDDQEQPVLYKPVDLLTVERAVDQVSVGGGL